MRPYSENALEIKLLFAAGIIDIADVVEWADCLFVQYPEYDDDIANVSLAGNANPREMVSLLDCLIDDHKAWNAMRRTLARMYDVLKDNPDRAHEYIRFLEWFAIKNYEDIPEDMERMAWFGDEYACAEQGYYGTVKEVTDDLLNYLSRYKGQESK